MARSILCTEDPYDVDLRVSDSNEWVCFRYAGREETRIPVRVFKAAAERLSDFRIERKDGKVTVYLDKLREVRPMGYGFEGPSAGGAKPK